MNREVIFKAFENQLATVLEYLEPSRIKDAMEYALLGGGKRIRPMLMLLALADYGLNPLDYLKEACAIEMIHTYSLIHDDLPGMDDDDMRRGRATVHKAFDEATAILAGDGLLSEAFYILSTSKIEDAKKIKMIQETVRSCGCNGMILGQELDLYANDSTNLAKMDELKTGCLFSLPLCMAAIIAGDFDTISKFQKIGAIYGVFFQIQDDLLEVTSDSATIGKTSNKEDEKENYVARFGVSKCEEIMNSLKQELADYEMQLSNMKGVFAYFKETYSRKY